MPFKKHKPEEIIGKLREVEIVLAQGGSTTRSTVGAGQYAKLDGPIGSGYFPVLSNGLIHKYGPSSPIINRRE